MTGVPEPSIQRESLEFHARYGQFDGPRQLRFKGTAPIEPKLARSDCVAIAVVDLPVEEHACTRGGQ